MVSVGVHVCLKGKTRVYFVDTEKTKLNLVNYMKLLDDGFLPDFVPVEKTTVLYIFQQGGATSRTSKVTQEHLDEEVPVAARLQSNGLSCACGTHSRRRFIGAALKKSLRRNSSKG
jgi:hypothetical protein